ncbi:D123-domain-containing protein [Geopyxis carbonaria]|nr:D123-domain-containing protein [Geopyxis carbonaria]
MPAIESPPESPRMSPAKTIHDVFPSVTKAHILNCSYPKWHAVYRTLTPRTRIIPLTPDFLDYIREDGIILPSDEAQVTSLDAEDSSSSEEDEEDEDEDEDDAPAVRPSTTPPNERFPALHEEIKTAIASLGGTVVPKLNWSAPKDAVFMSATNTLECRTPGEIYLLLKSSDFVTHDLEHAFDDCIDTPLLPGEDTVGADSIPYSLVLRKWFNCNPSLEFRCFVRGRRLLGVSQRDLNHYAFLHDMRDSLLADIFAFFVTHLRDSFPDDSFVFDVYVPSIERDDGARKVWLMDVNPFAPRTDAVLFSWLELLEEADEWDAPVMRLVKAGDPEAYSFNTPQYSTSKLPREVVQAGLRGENAVWEFAARWKTIMASMEEKRKERDAAGEGAQ